MPIYEYFCPKCKSKFELLRSISKSDEDGECPECQTQSQRTITAFVGRVKVENAGGAQAAAPVGGSSCTSCSSSSCSSCSSG